jgi:hypothetical protein
MTCWADTVIEADATAAANNFIKILALCIFVYKKKKSNLKFVFLHLVLRVSDNSQVGGHMQPRNQLSFTWNDMIYH